ncbi:MAG: hypothetical protein U0931_32160 [Vulcanimicrobiota bacterium]
MRNTLVAILCLSSLAGAEPSVIGDWRGSGGSIFHIPASSGQFKLRLTDSQGKVQNFQAQWEKPGQAFVWQDAQNTRHTAELDTHYKTTRFRDVGANFPDSPAYWYPVK